MQPSLLARRLCSVALGRSRVYSLNQPPEASLLPSLPPSVPSTHRHASWARPAFRVEDHCRQAAPRAAAAARCWASAATQQELVAREDRYQGMILQADALPGDPELFEERLAYSLQEWRRQGKRGIWLELATEQAALIPAAIAAGFDFRSARQGTVLLTKWLADAPDMLPHGPSHQVGVGAFVLNSRREMLLVQERHGLLDGKPFWKMPTGIALAGEDLTDAAEREVFEETGIRTAFHRVLAIRQSHGLGFGGGASDLFFVCAMRLMGEEQEVRLQQEEVVAAAWHPLADVERYPVFSGPSLAAVFATCRDFADGRSDGIRAETLANGFNVHSSLLLRP